MRLPRSSSGTLKPLYVSGPGLAPELALVRTIAGGGGDKDWRLGGELIYDDGFPNRYEPLQPGDVAAFEFIGDDEPHSVRAFFVAQSVPEDAALHAAFAGEFGARSMVEIEPGRFSELLAVASPASDHPIHSVVLETDLEDAAMGGADGMRRLRNAKGRRPISPDELERAKANAARIGQLGEELVNAHLLRELEEGRLVAVEWSSQADAVHPNDFRVTQADGTELRIEVKSTRRAHERPIHISLAELETATSGGAYHLYRVSGLEESPLRGSLRVARDPAPLVDKLLGVLSQLPAGVSADSLSMPPALFEWEDARPIRADEATPAQ